MNTDQNRRPVLSVRETGKLGTGDCVGNYFTTGSNVAAILRDAAAYHGRPIVIGPPRATGQHTAEYLATMSLAGMYLGDAP